MEKFFKLIPWLLLGLSVSMLLVVISNNDIGMNKVVEWTKSPIIISIVASAFIFLTIDRLKDITSRIGKIEDKTSSFWSSAIKEIQTVSSTHAKESIQGSIKQIEDKAQEVHNQIQSIIDSNPWLSSVNPEELVMSVKHLQPVHAKASKMLSNDNKGENVEIVRKWIVDLLNDPEMQGIANDYHNLGVVASRDLNDKLLSIQIYEKYLEKHKNHNADVLSDLLQDLTDIEDFTRAQEIADKILDEIEKNNKQFTKRWRPWVFLSDFYNAIGENQKGIEILHEARKVVLEKRGQAHVIRNLAISYESIGDLKSAEEMYLECLKDHPTHAPASLQLYNLYTYTGRTEEAKAVIEESIKFINFDPHFMKQYAKLTRIHKQTSSTETEQEGDRLMTGINLVLTVAEQELSKEDFESLFKCVKTSLQSQKTQQTA